MEENLKKLFGELKPFVEQARRVGCYSTTQETNFSAVLAILEKQSGVSLLTVGDLRLQLDELMKQHSRTSAASNETVETYKTRAKRLIEDFIKWSGGDFAAWKAEISKSNNNSRPSRPKPVRRTSIMQDVPTEQPDNIHHALRLSGGRSGELVLPSTLSSPDIESVWKQLTALKGLVEAQAEVLEGDE